MRTLDEIAAAVTPTGLAVVGAFSPTPEDKAPDGIAAMVLLGPAGPEMWARFQASPESQDGAADPLERWSHRIITGLARQFGAEAFFPFGGPPWMPFQRWAVAGEGAVTSPVAMQATPSRGLWASYRGALGFHEQITLPARIDADACRGCSAPCLSACPVNALEGGSYNVPRCTAHIRSEHGAACRDGCLVRQVCPAGSSVGLPVAQRRFHMDAFLAAHPA